MPRLGWTCWFGVFGVGRVMWVPLHFLALLLMPLTLSTQLRLYWNSSNEIFHSDNNDHVIDVNLGDRIDIICPHYTDTSVPWEYYIIYKVDKDNYDSCVINNTSLKTMIINCSKPNAVKAWYSTVLIREIQPIPFMPNFREGESYFFISTSGGHKSEINNQYQGACAKYNMRMILNVVPVYNSNPGVTTRRPTTTSSSGGGGGLFRTTTTRATTTTTTRPTTTTTRSRVTQSLSTSKSTAKPGNGGGDVPGGFPSDNVIHVGGGGDGGTKNAGTITDNGAASSWRQLQQQPHMLLLLLFLATLAVLVPR